MDLANARIVVSGTKAHKDRVQPLTADAAASLRPLQAKTLKDRGPFRGMCPGSVNGQFNAIVRDAGIASCTIHDLRRTFCTDLARLDINHLIVQRLAGHASAVTTARYYQAVHDAMKREAVVRLARTAS